jgi:hypothetical protein
MNVLLLESDAHAADEAAARLRAAGHQVERCHEVGLPAFPCNGLLDGGECPLDRGPIEVALVVRSHPWPRPSTLEDGVVCALRRGVPLVVAGRALLNPYVDWAAAVVDGVEDVVEAIEKVARTAPHPAGP